MASSALKPPCTRAMNGLLPNLFRIVRFRAAKRARLRVMNVQQSRVTFVAVMLGASISASFAGPCSEEIDRVQAKIDTKLEALAAVGRPARESVAATLHRQPTPESIAAAEVKLGDISDEKVLAVETLMTRARQADSADDPSACEQALAEVQRLIEF
jgi:GTP cyclohydrolase FolE2